MRERRLKLFAIDADPATSANEIRLPVTEECPEGASVVSVFPYPLQNCALVFVSHSTFKETAPFERFDAMILPNKEA